MLRIFPSLRFYLLRIGAIFTPKKNTASAIVLDDIVLVTYPPIFPVSIAAVYKTENFAPGCVCIGPRKLGRFSLLESLRR